MMETAGTMKETKRSLRTLRDILPGRIYIFLDSADTCRRFYEDAETEGYHFGKWLPTESKLDDLVALEPEKQLSHVGFVGRMAFRNPENVMGPFYRVDYRKYSAGEEDFYYQDSTVRLES